MAKEKNGDLYKLKDGSRVGVIGGGPAGSFFSYFLLDMAERSGLDIRVDIYEPRDYFSPGGCNMCGGIISESLVQNLAIEGINLPPQIVQRGIDSYSLHSDKGSVRIDTPLREKRIAAVHRGCGPKDVKETKWGSFDGFLQILALEKGANLFQKRVEDVQKNNQFLQILTSGETPINYDLLTVAVGINSNLLKKFPRLSKKYHPPQKTKTLIREFYLGEKAIAAQLGSSMHIFLLNIPGLEFAAFIPKGDYITLCMLGHNLGKETLETFIHSAAVTRVMPPIMADKIHSCHCNPHINIRGAVRPYSDRMVFIGDSGVTRLFKDGIGAAYRTAKAAAATVVFEGISTADFQRHFWPACRKIKYDNLIGRAVFSVNQLNQRFGIARSSLLRMVREEQQNNRNRKYMSLVLWDMFTGSSPYLEILLIILHPGFFYGFIKSLLLEIFTANKDLKGVRV